MPSLNFQRRFAPLVKAGTKRSTIRRRRKDGRDPKPGQTLYHFTGMRTKQCDRLLETRCENVRNINIIQKTSGPIIRVRGRAWEPDEIETLWQQEGFDSLRDMLAWFRQTHGPRFSGLLIEW